MDWPTSPELLRREQERIAGEKERRWTPPPGPWSIGGCFVCFPRLRPGAGAAGDPAWAAAALVSADRPVVIARVSGFAGAPYRAGFLALREGPLLEAAVRGLPGPPAVLLVNATGRDHPRRAGLARQLGAVLDLPSVGVTHRPLLATGCWPELARGGRAPLLLAGERVGHWLCTRDGARPLAVHPGWRTDAETAIAVVLGATSGRVRTPEPLRRARRAAREARAAAAGEAGRGRGTV